MLDRMKRFFDDPTKAKNNAICITGIVCTAVCLIDWILSLGSLLFFYREHWIYWNYFFREFLKYDISSLLLLLSLLLSFCQWKRGKRFRFALAVPLILMYTFAVSIFSFISAWMTPGSSIEGNSVLTILTFLVSVAMTICLLFLVLAVAGENFRSIALITFIPIILNLLFALVNWILYHPISHPADVLGVFPLVLERVAWLLFCAGWYMKQKEYDM